MGRFVVAFLALALAFAPALSFLPLRRLASPQTQALRASIQDDIATKMKEAMKAKDIASLPTVSRAREDPHTTTSL